MKEHGRCNIFFVICRISVISCSGPAPARAMEALGPAPACNVDFWRRRRINVTIQHLFQLFDEIREAA